MIRLHLEGDHIEKVPVFFPIISVIVYVDGEISLSRFLYLYAVRSVHFHSVFFEKESPQQPMLDGKAIPRAVGLLL